MKLRIWMTVGVCVALLGLAGRLRPRWRWRRRWRGSWRWWQRRTPGGGMPSGGAPPAGHARRRRRLAGSGSAPIARLRSVGRRRWSARPAARPHPAAGPALAQVRRVAGGGRPAAPAPGRQPPIHQADIGAAARHRTALAVARGRHRRRRRDSPTASVTAIDPAACRASATADREPASFGATEQRRDALQNRLTAIARRPTGGDWNQTRQDCRTIATCSE